MNLLLQSAIDRFLRGAHILLIEGPLWLQCDVLRVAPQLTKTRRPAMLDIPDRWSHTCGTKAASYRCQATETEQDDIEDPFRQPFEVDRAVVAWRLDSDAVTEYGVRMLGSQR